MEEITIKNPSDYNVSPEQFKAQEEKYKKEEAAAIKAEADRKAAAEKKDHIDDSLATTNMEMQALKKLQIDVKADDYLSNAQRKDTPLIQDANPPTLVTKGKDRARKIADILATAKTEEEQKQALEALDGKPMLVSQKKEEPKKEESAPKKEETAPHMAQKTDSTTPPVTDQLEEAKKIGDILASNSSVQEQDAQITALKPLNPALIEKTGANSESTMTP